MALRSAVVVVCIAYAAAAGVAVAEAQDLSASPPPQRGMLALDFGLGFALGGDDLVYAEFDTGEDTTLSAGNGVIVNLGATVTPLWFGRIGLGASVDLGIKYAGIEASNGSVSFTRFPVVASAHGLFSVNTNWSVLVAGGLHYDLGASLSGDGLFDDLQFDSESALGFMIEAGGYYEERPLGIDVTLRYTALEYEFDGRKVDGMSIGLFGTFHFIVL